MHASVLTTLLYSLEKEEMLGPFPDEFTTALIRSNSLPECTKFTTIFTQTGSLSTGVASVVVSSIH